MPRVFLATCALFLTSTLARAGDPKPVWEFQANGGEKTAAPAWLSYSPDGKAVVAVTMRQNAGSPPTYTYHLRVWDANTRKERFNAALGSGKAYHWGDDLAAFPTDDTVMTGGPQVMVRNLENGTQTLSAPTGGLSDHAVYAVPDLKESFHIRRDPQSFDLPVEVLLRSSNLNRFDEWGNRVRRGNDAGFSQTTLVPPREGLRAEALAFNPGRTALAVAFRDDANRSRNRIVLYRIRTLDDFELSPITEAAYPHAGAVAVLTFARNGRVLATGGEDGSVCLWDVTSNDLWKPRATVSGLTSHRVYALAFSPDWRYLAAATWDKSKPNLLLIDVDSGKVVRTLKLERELTAVAWHPECHTLLTAGASGMVQAWDATMLVKGN